MGRWGRRLTVLAYCSLIFFLSSQQIPEEMPGFKGMDLFIHFFVYGVLAFLICWMLSKENSKFLNRYLFIISWLLTVGYGVSDELHQSFVPTRHMSLWDLLADALGAAVSLLILALRDYEP
jgi:VanZ family protein